MPRRYYVYILSNTSKCLYIGVTNNILRRWIEHSTGRGSQFCAKYHLRHLVHVEQFARPGEAIQREKQLKHWPRKRKIELITTVNPGWRDLAVQWQWHRIEQ